MRLVKQHCAASFEDRQHGLAAGGGVATEHGGDLVLKDQFRGLFAEGLRIGGTVFNDDLDLPTEHAAGRVDFGHGHHDAVGQKLFSHGKATRLRVERADLDGIGGKGPAAESRQGECGGSGSCGFQKFTSVEHHLGSPFFDWRTQRHCPAQGRGFHAEKVLEG
ncbi:hypothetical protein D3C86_1602910 [compost metagenome]